jgi:serine/threonine-protein kinase
VVLYEMLTGDPPFTGSTAQAIVARVVTESPRPLLPQRHTIPAHVEAAVLTALEKLPADRFATAAQFAEALAHPTAATTRRVAVVGSPGVAPQAAGLRARLRDPVVVGLALLTFAAVGFAATRMRRPAPEPPPPTVRFGFSGSDSLPAVENYPWPAAISPDGGLVVYSVAGPGASTVLYARRADQLEGHPIPGTTNGTQPLFSPDGRWLAFEAGGMEKKIRLDGSAPVTIAPGGAANGADWTTTNELVVGATGKAHGLSRVSVAGGELAPFTVPDSARGEVEHIWPIATPDGHGVVFIIWSGALLTSELAITSLDGGPVARLGLKGIRPLAVVGHTLVYVQADGTVMAVELDPPHRRVEGKPVPVLDPVPVVSSLNGNSAIFVSRGGALVTGHPTNLGRLVWLGRDGKAQPISSELHNFSAPRLSPDGRSIAVLVTDGPKADIWILDLATRTLSRLTNAGTVTSAEWSRDGARMVYLAPGSSAKDVVWAQPVGNATSPEALVELPALGAYADLAPDGQSLLLQVIRNTLWNVERVTLGAHPEFHPFQGLGTPAALAPRFSPDGRWAAVESFESGTAEIYVCSFPEPKVRVQVSVGGGGAPVWSADGTRLYYATGSVIVEARLATAAGLRVVSRDTVFTGVPNAAATSFGQANFDVSRDGSRIVIPSVQSSAYPLVVVPNWGVELRERLAANRQ